MFLAMTMLVLLIPKPLSRVAANVAERAGRFVPEGTRTEQVMGGALRPALPLNPGSVLSVRGENFATGATWLGTSGHA